MSVVTLLASIAEIAGRETSGIQVSLVHPPETINRYPASFPNPASGTVQRMIEARWRHRIELIVFVAPREKNLPVEFSKVSPLITAVEETFWTAYVGQDFPGNISKALVVDYQVGLREFAGRVQHTVTFGLDVEETTQ